MKVLVIDDLPQQREAAKQALECLGHEVIVADGFESAMQRLAPKLNNERMKTLLQESGFPYDLKYSEKVADQWKSFCDAKEQSRKAAMEQEIFDAVLTDQMMPSELDCGGHKGSPTPFGMVIAMYAIMNTSTKFVAIVSNGQSEDGNHHNHPVLAAMDYVAGGNVETSDGKKLMIFAGYECPHMSKEALPDLENPYEIKDWATVLSKLTAS